MLNIWLVRFKSILHIPTPVFVVRAINDTVARENVLETMQHDPYENRRSWAEGLTADGLTATCILPSDKDMQELQEKDLR